MTTLFAVIGTSLLISFLCSVLEAVILSTSHSYVVLLQEKGSRAGTILARMRENIDEPIAAILTLNTIAHTVGAAMGGAIALEVFGDRWIALFSAVLTLAILVFSEILPKTLGATYWQELAPLAARILQVLMLLLRPVLIPLAWFNRLVSPRGSKRPRMSRAELEVLAEIGRKEGVIDEEEWQVVTNVINLNRRRVEEVMTPRTRIVAVDVSAGVARARDVFLAEGHGRIPVFRGSIDDVVGVLLARDVWRACEEGVQDLREIMRAPRFVPETKTVEALIRELRSEQINLAIVVDEFGGTAGMVTLEDLIEEIVGEIRDEHELAPLGFEVLESGEVRMAGGVETWEASERIGYDLPDGEYTTLGGFILSRLGRIPKEGDEITAQGGKFRILRMEGRRIARVAFLPGDARPRTDPPNSGGDPRGG